MGYTLKQIIGATLIDLPQFEWRLRASWLHVRNRNERVTTSADGRGVTCQWQWTSDLHVSKVFPFLGSRLMARCLRDWPIEFAPAPSERRGEIQVSFIIGHRGLQRVPLLLSTLATIAAQRDATCECIVVEQSVVPEIRDSLPSWVRYVHTPLPAADMPYCRSWTLNVGARLARGALLVLHDNDMLVPKAYATELWARYQEGYKVINLKRFIFYLGEQHSRQVLSSNAVRTDAPVATVVQNLEAGGSISIAREEFLAIGGFDESFVGWGGEDNEFWERAKTLKVWPYSCLPIVHLWHTAQPRKNDPANPTLCRLKERSAIPPVERIVELARREFGNPQKLSSQWP